MTSLEGVSPFDVLLVEDEPADAHLVRIALRDYPVACNLHHVSDGVDAMAFLRQEGIDHRAAPRPNLILLDFNMPRMNGREFLEAIKADDDFKSIPVVVLSTSDVERDVVTSYRMGAASYITKPVDMTEFFAAMHEIGDYWFTLSRLPNHPS